MYYTDLTTDSWWKNSITANDQLRQRVAFAFSQITVVSSSGVLEDQAQALSYFYDTLLDNAFGNFKDLLKAVTLTPAMGIYLDMRKNDKPSLVTGIHANENYAREIQQLFSIGLYRMWPDGSLMLNSKGAPIPTYDQDVITGFANAFTGWNYNQPNSGGFLPTNFSPAADYINPMKEVPKHHFTGPKRILDNVVLPGLHLLAFALRSGAIVVLDPYANHTAAQIQTPEYQALPSQELEATHAALFNHPNCGPFICRELIQRLVTSTPSPGYLYRVVQAFNGERDVHGVATGVRGNLKDVIKAILLDDEARSAAVLTQQGYGKQREPVTCASPGPVRAFAPGAVAGRHICAGWRRHHRRYHAGQHHRLISGNNVSLGFLRHGRSAPPAASIHSPARSSSTPTDLPRLSPHDGLRPQHLHAERHDGIRDQRQQWQRHARIQSPATRRISISATAPANQRGDDILRLCRDGHRHHAFHRHRTDERHGRHVELRRRLPPRRICPERDDCHHHNRDESRTRHRCTGCDHLHRHHRPGDHACEWHLPDHCRGHHALHHHRRRFRLPQRYLQCRLDRARAEPQR